MEQVPQESGHAAETPTNLHLFLVSLFPTHSHDLEIRIPFLRNFILIDESTQDPIVGAADGEGEGLIDSVGVFVGSGDGLLLG